RSSVIAVVATRPQPLLFYSPIGVLFGLPNVLATKAEAKCFKAHRLVSDRTGQNHQVSPTQAPSVLLLDRPQQATRLVDVAIVRPRADWRKSLVASTATASTVKEAIRTSSVPGHADHQPAVVPPIRGPPRLAVGHQGVQVLLQGRNVQLFELL